MNFTIIHKHKYQMGGLGDFIRASLSLYALCQKFGIEYFIDFDENPYLKDCFEYKNIELSEETKKNIISFYRISSIVSEHEFCKFLYPISQQHKIIYLYCNEVGFVKLPIIQKYLDSYQRNILKPSLLLQENIESLMKNYELNENDYISFQIRCGDYSMDKKETTDRRVEINNMENYYQLHKKIEDKIKLNPLLKDKKIVIHSDSNYFKEKMKELYPGYLYPKIIIKHVAEEAGVNTLEGYLSTLSEFYLISKAYQVFIPFSYSGFSHWAAILGKKELISDIKDPHLNCL